MKKGAKLWTVIALAASLALTSACSGNNGGTASPTPGGNNSGAEQGGSQQPVAIKIMANFSTANISEADAAFFAKSEEAVNVKLDFNIPPASGYQEQLQLTLVSGEYPDVVFFPNEQSDAYINAVNDGVIIPLNDLLSDAPNLTDYTYDVSWEALKTKRDDNIFAIPRTTIARNDNFMVRKDWLDQIGFEIPEDHEITVDQFTDILYKFTFEDPDNNGLADTYGLQTHLNDAKVMLPALTAQFGDLGWRPSGGEFPYMTAQYDRESDSYKRVLDYTQQLFKAGVIDPDAAVIDNKTANERFKRGITGVMRNFAGHVPTYEREMKDINPEAELTYLFVKDDDGKLIGSAYGTGIWGLWGITKSAQNPERIIEWFDWLLSDEGWEYVRFGVEGVDYKLVDGVKTYDPEVKAPWRQSVLRRAYDSDFFVAPSLPAEQQEMVKPWIEKSVQSAEFSLDMGFVPPASKEPAYLDNKLNWDQIITRIMIGELSVDSFDGLLESWYSNGGQKYTEQMIEFIQGQ